MKRTLMLLSLLLIWGGYSSAQDDGPMGSCNCVCKQGTSKCMPSFQSFCNANTCAISACGSPAQVDLTKTAFILGGCPFVPTPGTYDTLVTHVAHSIGHQGARVWTGTDSNSVASGEDLRVRLLSATNNSSNPDDGVLQAVSELQNAKLDDLQKAAKDAIDKCVGAYPPDRAFQDFNWVARVRGQAYVLAAEHNAKDYDGMRSTFSIVEADHDNFRNNLYCYSGTRLDDLMTRLGPLPPQPKLPVPPHYPVHGGYPSHEGPEH